MQQPNPPSQHPHFFHPLFDPYNLYFTPSGSWQLLDTCLMPLLHILTESVGINITAIKDEVHTVHDFSVGDERNLKNIQYGNPLARRSLNTGKLIRVIPV